MQQSISGVGECTDDAGDRDMPDEWQILPYAEARLHRAGTEGDATDMMCVTEGGIHCDIKTAVIRCKHFQHSGEIQCMDGMLQCADDGAGRQIMRQFIANEGTETVPGDTVTSDAQKMHREMTVFCYKLFAKAGGGLPLIKLLQSIRKLPVGK